MVRTERVPEGHKKTEVGVIPEEWAEVSLGDCTSKVGSGLTPAGGERVYTPYGRPFVRSQNVGWGLLILDDVAFIDEQTHMAFRGTQLEAGDVLLNITGASIGRSAVADHRVQGGNVNQHVCIIRPDPEELDARFLNYLLLSSLGQRQIDSFQAGGNRQGLNFGQIRSFRLPIPPLLEQRAISASLSDVDALISSINKLIAKKQDIKQAAMQQLLTGKKRLPGFAGDWRVETLSDTGYRKTEVGVIPQEWEVKRLGEIFMFLRTGTNSRSELADEGNIGYIHYGDIHSKWDTVLDCSIAQIPYIEEKKARNLPRLRDGDLVMVDASEDYVGLGKSVEITNIGEQEIVAGLHTILLRGNKELVADGFKGFLQFMQPVRESLCSIATGISVYGISKRNLQDISVPLPPLAEQKAIAQVLSDMNSEIEALEKKLDKYKLIKEGMMEELLTGKVRLV